MYPTELAIYGQASKGNEEDKVRWTGCACQSLDLGIWGGGSARTWCGDLRVWLVLVGVVLIIGKSIRPEEEDEMEALLPHVLHARLAMLSDFAFDFVLCTCNTSLWFIILLTSYNNTLFLIHITLFMAYYFVSVLQICLLLID